MTNEQQLHMAKLMNAAALQIFERYQQGARQHSDLLSDKSELELLDDAIEECVDQFTYLMTLRWKMVKRLGGGGWELTGGAGAAPNS